VPWFGVQKGLCNTYYITQLGCSQNWIYSNTFVKSLYISSQIARWQALLTEYDIVYMTRKDVKGSVIADQLAYNALEDYMPLNFDLLDEDVLVVDGDGEMND
jgi:hypothetical protein